MSEPHELERFGVSPEVEAAEWVRAADATWARACGALLAMDLAVRVSSVGYGRALRFAVTDRRGWSCGWTVGAHEELLSLCHGLLADGAREFIERALEKPLKRR